MFSETILVNVGVFVVVFAFVLYRQFSTRRVSARTFLLVVILLLYGVWAGLPGTVLGLVVLLVSAVVSIGFGVWRGTSMRMWRAADGSVYRRGTRLTVTLWVISVAINLVLDGCEVSATHIVVAGAIWLGMALTLGVQQYIMLERARSLTGA